LQTLDFNLLIIKLFTNVLVGDEIIKTPKIFLAPCVSPCVCLWQFQ